MKKRTVLFEGRPVEVVGPALRLQDAAPGNFTVTANDMSEVRGTAIAGRLRVICSVLSLDTAVCDTEMKHFTRDVMELPNAELYAISMDLPFAQRRWCAATGNERVRALSDFKNRSFGSAYGVLCPDLGLLVRAVFVVGRDDEIHHVQYVDEATSEPNYAAALAALHAVY